MTTYIVLLPRFCRWIVLLRNRREYRREVIATQYRSVLQAQVVPRKLNSETDTGRQLLQNVSQ